MGGKGSCAVCVDLQAVGLSCNSSFGPFLRGFGQDLEKGRVLIHQHFAISTGICEVVCPLPASRVDKPLTISNTIFQGWDILFSSFLVIATFLADMAKEKQVHCFSKKSMHRCHRWTKGPPLYSLSYLTEYPV